MTLQLRQAAVPQVTAGFVISWTHIYLPPGPLLSAPSYIPWWVSACLPLGFLGSPVCQSTFLVSWVSTPPTIFLAFVMKGTLFSCCYPCCLKHMPGDMEGTSDQTDGLLIWTTSSLSWRGSWQAAALSAPADAEGNKG